VPRRQCTSAHPWHCLPAACPAVAALEGLALRDEDPRARRACSLPLASLSYSAKHRGLSGAPSAGSSTSSTDAASRSLQQLPPDGALRPLLEALLEARWGLLQGQQSADVAVPGLAWPSPATGQLRVPPQQPRVIVPSTHVLHQHIAALQMRMRICKRSSQQPVLQPSCAAWPLPSACQP
jgi:hypothetical protein